MKNKFIKDFHESERISTPLLVKNKNVIVDKQGKNFLFLTLSDKTGQIEGRLWDNVDHFIELFDVDDVVNIEGSTQVYQGQLQLKLSKITPINDDKINIEDFYPSANRPVNELLKELKQIINREIKDVFMSKLLNNLLSDKDILGDFKTTPAAKHFHHAYIGGLLDHTLSVLKLSIGVVSHYREIYPNKFNRELVYTGIIIHDIGKIKEISSRNNFAYTDEGRLLGHILLGMELIERKIDEISDFPEELRLQILHIIASHHGIYEFGSPKRPKTLEAVIVHYLDDLDSKINSFVSAVNAVSDEEQNWTPYNRQYERYLYKRVYNGDNKVEFSSEEDNPESEKNQLQLGFFNENEIE